MLVQFGNAGNTLARRMKTLCVEENIIWSVRVVWRYEMLAQFGNAGNTQTRRMKTLCVEKNIIWWEKGAARIDCCCSRLARVAYCALGKPNCLTDVEVLFVTLLWRWRLEENQIHVFELKINSVDFEIPIGSKSNSLYTHLIPLNLKSDSESIEKKQDVN
jgi:hypothetical protein